MDKKQMIENIMLAYKASEVSRPRPEGKGAELFLQLVFLDDLALNKICHELCINTSPCGRDQ